MIRTKGEAGTGNVVEAVRHCRAVMGDIGPPSAMDDEPGRLRQGDSRAARAGALRQTKTLGRMPVVNFGGGRRGDAG